ncbi:putative [histone H3]-dimethyl-L-lysine(36) demethylase chromatin regulator PHD family [Helianthus annuus]|nr:putative [histone H3]-dimethyl-L-lysine(36) demethylase chromatin regulator PHD family [Helianthus annuus]
MKPAELDKPSYIARVEKLMADDENSEMMAKIRCYYRPEDTEDGRRPFHGEKEIFLSNDYDTQSTQTIQGKCVVHTFQKYIKLKDVGIDDYFCRYEYDAGKRDQPVAAGERFTPKRVTVYCKCNMPYNPEAYMVQCDKCKDWYHPSCLGLEIEDHEKLEEFVCSKCRMMMNN